MWWTGLAWAASCPESPVWATVLTDDGGAQAVVWDGAHTCWWTIDDQDERRLSGHWDGRRPVALTAWGDSGLAVVLEDAQGWRLYVATDPGAAERIGVPLPSAPNALKVRPGRMIELWWHVEGGPDRMWLLDVPRERVVEGAG